MANLYTTPSSRWSALVSRDPSADGKFFYSVKSTMIYCRPNCKARLARRSNVEFHKTASEAERAGFRACKRCRPDLVSYDPQTDAVYKACATIVNSKEDGPLPTLDVLAEQAGFTKSHFHRLFKRTVGVTPKGLGDAVRNSRNREAMDTETVVTATPTLSTDTEDSSTLSASPLNLDQAALFDSSYWSPSMIPDLSGSVSSADAVSPNMDFGIMPLFEDSDVQAPFSVASLDTQIWPAAFADDPKPSSDFWELEYDASSMVDFERSLESVLGSVTSLPLADAAR